MPAISVPSAPPGTLIDREIALNTNGSQHVLQVVCAWPVSGQYGPGTRILYYVLVAACVLGRGSEWLKGACLAGALLLPAVAALHGIVLAAVHVDGAVDMDVYGTFQLCAIGVLAGPATAKISRTYFNTPGRNLIFLWTGMVLSGLLSLTVEFFRANPVSCPAGDFSPVEDNACNLTCSVAAGPTSPLRGGSQNNIYVIEAPDKLRFGTATLLAAACCIPAILSLVSMWDKILMLNWKKLFEPRGDNEESRATGTSSGANMLGVNGKIRGYLSRVEILVFGAAISAILVVGEMNFFSSQVSYMTEPIASVGQWAPIVGTGLAALGSLYALLAADASKETSQTSSKEGTCHCTCSQHRPFHEIDSFKTPSHLQGGGGLGAEVEHVEARGDAPEMSHRPTSESVASRHPSRRSTPTMTRAPSRDENLNLTSTMGTTATADAGNRRKIARMLERAAQWASQQLETPAPDAFDDSKFWAGAASGFPTVPGEAQRNAELPHIRATYNLRRDSDGHVTPIPRRQHSRPGSFTGSTTSGPGVEGVSGTASQGSEPLAGPSSPPTERIGKRRSTLEVPKPVYHSLVPRRDSSVGSIARDDAAEGPISPTIRVSPEADS